MATYNKISDEIPVINVPAEGKTIETQYYIGLEKQDEDKEFINNINEGTIENTTIDWCNIQYNQVDDTAKQIKLITTTNLAENERDCEIRFFNSDFSDNDVKIKIIQAGANFEFAYYNISGTKIIQNNTNETLVISNDNINTASEIFKFKFGKKETQNWITTESNYSLSGTLDNKNINDYFKIYYTGNDNQMVLRLKQPTTCAFNKSSQEGQIICNLNNNQYILQLYLYTEELPLTKIFFAVYSSNKANQIPYWSFEIFTKGTNNTVVSALTGNLSIGIQNNVIDSNIFYNRQNDEINPDGIYAFAQIIDSNLGGLTKTIFENIAEIKINNSTVFTRRNTNKAIYEEIPDVENDLIGSLTGNYLNPYSFSVTGYLIKAREIGR